MLFPAASRVAVPLTGVLDQKAFSRPVRAIALPADTLGDGFYEEALPHRPRPRYRDQFTPKRGLTMGFTTRDEWFGKSTAAKAAPWIAAPWRVRFSALAGSAVFSRPSAAGYPVRTGSPAATHPFGFQHQPPITPPACSQRSCRRLAERQRTTGSLTTRLSLRGRRGG